MDHIREKNIDQTTSGYIYDLVSNDISYRAISATNVIISRNHWMLGTGDLR